LAGDDNMKEDKGDAGAGAVMKEKRVHAIKNKIRRREEMLKLKKEKKKVSYYYYCPKLLTSLNLL
jgi:hypothetical protein